MREAMKFTLLLPQDPSLTYVVLSVEYSLFYDATYKESENLRIDLQGILATCPFLFFKA